MGAMPFAQTGRITAALAASDRRRPQVRGLLRPADAIHGLTRGVGKSIVPMGRSYDAAPGPAGTARRLWIPSAVGATGCADGIAPMGRWLPAREPCATHPQERPMGAMLLQG